MGSQVSNPRIVSTLHLSDTDHRRYCAVIVRNTIDGAVFSATLIDSEYNAMPYETIPSNASRSRQHEGRVAKMIAFVNGTITLQSLRDNWK